MSITDELREWVTGAKPAVVDGCSISVGTMTYGCKKALLAIADSIDAEHKKACDDAWDNGYEADYLGIEKWLTEHPQAMEHHGLIRLPKDADGEYIRVGERVQLIGNDPSTVSHMSLSDDGWRVYVKYDGGIGTGSGEPKRIRHYHAPTVEDVLTEMVAKLIERGELTNGAAQTITEYAAKLQLREDA